MSKWRREEVSPFRVDWTCWYCGPGSSSVKYTDGLEEYCPQCWGFRKQGMRPWGLMAERVGNLPWLPSVGDRTDICELENAPEEMASRLTDFFFIHGSGLPPDSFGYP